MVLPQLMKIQCFAKMVGEYNFTKSLLYTEKLAGNITGCMGFVRDGQFYIPNTTLKEDIRDIARKPQQRMLIICKKLVHQENYEEVCYTAKGVEPDKIMLASPIKGKVNILHNP